MEHVLDKVKESLLQEASRRKRARKARTRREKQRRKEAALAKEVRANRPVPRPVDRLVISEAQGTNPPIEDWVLPEESRTDAETMTSESEEGVGRMNPLPKRSRATIARGARAYMQLTRMRRAEKKILHDQIRERRQANGRRGPTAGNRLAEGPVEAGG
jgi:hypothetical protein